MRFTFIEAEKARFPVTMMCRLLEVSRSGFYASRGRRESTRAGEDRRLVNIKASHTASRGTYGSPRVHRDLVEDGVAVGRHRVLMHQEGLRSKRRRRYRVTTNSDHHHPVAANVLERDFTADAENCKWAADITYVWTRCGWLYLAVVLDLYSRRVVGWAMSTRIIALCLVEPPGEFAGLFRRRIAWDDGAIWEAVGVGAVAVLMNRCCRSGEDVGARAPSVGKRWGSASFSRACPHGP